MAELLVVGASDGAEHLTRNRLQPLVEFLLVARRLHRVPKEAVHLGKVDAVDVVDQLAALHLVQLVPELQQVLLAVRAQPHSQRFHVGHCCCCCCRCCCCCSCSSTVFPPGRRKKTIDSAAPATSRTLVSE